ncbi:MAG: TonB-dependent receptor [Bacteroidota bacterium]
MARFQPNINHKILGLFLCLLISFSSTAQNTTKIEGKITGKIIDSLSGKPMEYVSISLVSLQANKVVNGTSSDSKGFFKITNIPEGSYKLLFDFMGFHKSEIKPIIVNKENLNLVLKDLKLVPKQTMLDVVAVTGARTLIEDKIDKTIYNADKDITSQTGVAADVLKKVPQVSVDVDGNVELQGNANIRFLINGKPSILFGSNIVDVLQSIPASQIQSIEVITSPGAKYDAEGTGGIINIILKKNSAAGFNGNLSISGGTRLENGALNMNIRKGNFGVNVFFSGNAQLPSQTINNMNRLSQDSITSTQLLQNGTSEFERNGYQSGISFDWDISPRDNFTGNFNYDYFGNNNSGNANRQTLCLDASGNQLSDFNDVILTSNKFHEHSFDGGLTYKRKFKKEDHELEIQLNSSNGNIFSYYNQTQKNLLSNEVYNSSYGNNPGIENETNIEANYTLPITENAIFETGAKAEFNHINSVSNVYLLFPTTGNYDYSTAQSSSVDYKRTVYAGYLSATFNLFKFLDVKAGLRDEYTQANANFSNVGLVTIKPYNTIVPSLVFSHKFKNKQTLKISYSHRIERPDYRDLNPFFNASDPRNITTGNPNLRPEIGDKIELGYNQTFKNGITLNSTLFYRGNMDDIQAYTNYYSTYVIGDSTFTNVAISSRENIGREDNFGASLYTSIPINSKINIRGNISFFDRYIYTGLPSGGNIHGFIYRANLNASYQISNTLVIELLGNFNSPKINAQGTMPSFTTYNFAFRKQIFNKKASIAFTATNFLEKYVNQKTELTGANFKMSNVRQLPYQSFGFNFTYKFGKMAFKKEKEMEDVNISNPPEFVK